MPTGTPAVVEKVSQWGFQNYHIERLMDHSALTAAHPDTTLVFAGPSRWSGGASPDGQTNIIDKLLPLGMMQQVNIQQALGIVPAMAIGSARKFYLDGPTNNALTIARLLLNGRNLLRALATNAIQAGVNVKMLDAAAATINNGAFLVNLDSEIFKVPVGFGAVFYDRTHHWIGSVYLEHARIQTYGLGWAPGQPMIMENVQMVFDRVVPIGTVVGVANPQADSTSGLLEASLGEGIADDTLPLDDGSIAAP